MQLGLPDLPTAANIQTVVELAAAELWDMVANGKGTLAQIIATMAPTGKGKSGKKGTDRPDKNPDSGKSSELCRSFQDTKKWMSARVELQMEASIRACRRETLL